MTDEENYYPLPLEIELTTIHRGENTGDIRGVKIKEDRGSQLGLGYQLITQEGIWWDDRDAEKAYRLLKIIAQMYNKLQEKYVELTDDD